MATRGRPRVFDGEREQIRLRIPADVMKQVRQEATRRAVSLHVVATAAFSEWLERSRQEAA
jgi:hypothetical protein